MMFHRHLRMNLLGRVYSTVQSSTNRFAVNWRVAGCSLAIFIGYTISVRAEFIELSNQDGQTIRCQIEGMDIDKLKLRKEDGRLFEYPINKLDEESAKLATLHVQRIYKPSLKVRSLKSSMRESSHHDLNGREHHHVSKSRTFQIEVRTFCPLDTKVKIEWYYFSGKSKYSVDHKEGVVSANTKLEVVATESTHWHGIDNSGWDMGKNVDFATGSKKLDLVVLLRLEDGSIARKYSTSKFAEDYVLQKFGGE